MFMIFLKFIFFPRYEGSLQPIEGIVSIEKARLKDEEQGQDESAGKFVPYHIGCESKYSSKSPYGILLIHGKGITII